MKDRVPHLRPVSSAPNQSGPVPRAALLRAIGERKATRQQERAATLLATRRHDIIGKLLAAMPREKSERVLGAGYAELGSMTDIQFGSYLARIEIALGDPGA